MPSVTEMNRDPETVSACVIEWCRPASCPRIAVWVSRRVISTLLDMVAVATVQPVA